MAITKTVVSISTLADFLETTGYFGEVTYENSVVTCKDSDGNILAKFENKKVTAYTNDTTSASKDFTQQTLYVRAAYTCSNGILIEYGATGYTTMHVLITKTNNDKIAFIIPNTLTVGGSCSVFCIAWGDENANVFYHSTTQANQTILRNFGTRNVVGTASYTPNAYTVVEGQYYNIGVGEVTIDGTLYLTNGYWAIRDGD